MLPFTMLISMKQLLISALILVLSHTTFAADLSEVDRFLDHPSFESAFALKDYVVVDNKSCINAAICSSFESSTVVVDFNPMAAKVEVWDAGGRKQQFTFTKDQWAALDGNMIRNAIKINESFGVLTEITSITPVEYSVEINKKPVTLQALEIRALGTNQLKIKMQLRWIIARETGGLGQLLLQETIQKGGRLELRQVLSFSRADQRANF